MIDILGIKRRIKEMRKASGYSVREVADTLNLAYGSVRKWENTSSSPYSIPTIDHIIDLCELYGTDPNYILLGKEE